MNSFESILRSAWGISLAIFFFGLTIFIHELGHFLAAKKRGLKVERFSIGFGPKVWGRTGKDGVDYRISLFPLGGYVALPQMADMSAVEGASGSDSEKLPKVGYVDKMLVAVMGAAFNILFALALACVLSVFGKPEPVGDNSAVIGHIAGEISAFPGGEKVKSPAAKADLRVGDRVLAVDGSPVGSFSELKSAVALGSGRDEEGPVALLEIEREGVRLPAPVKVRPLLVDPEGNGDSLRMLGVSGVSPLYVDVDGAPFGPAAKAGIKTGDRILSINDTEILSYEHLREYISAASDRPVRVLVERADGEGKGSNRVTLTVTPEFVALSHPSLALDFTESGVPRRVEFIAVPDNPELTLKSLAEPRTRLMVRAGLLEGSAHSESFLPGALLTCVTGKGVVQRTGNFEAVIAEASDLPPDAPLTLYFESEGRASNVTLRGASFSVVQPKAAPFIGINLQRRVETVRRAPWVYLGETFSSTMATLRSLLSPRSDVNVKHLTGVIGISRIYYGISENLMMVLWFTLVVNVNLAVMNLLPLPVLDGGHMVYATLEKIRGRPLPLKFMQVVQTSFVVLLFGIMAFVLWRDLNRIRVEGVASRRDLIEAFAYRKPEFAPPPGSAPAKESVSAR